MGTRLSAARAASLRKQPCKTCDFIRSLSKADRDDFEAAVADPTVTWPAIVTAFADLDPPSAEAMRSHHKRGHHVEA